jgi:hypothetical protein
VLNVSINLAASHVPLPLLPDLLQSLVSHVTYAEHPAVLILVQVLSQLVDELLLVVLDFLVSLGEGYDLGALGLGHFSGLFDVCFVVYNAQEKSSSK